MRSPPHAPPNTAPQGAAARRYGAASLAFGILSFLLFCVGPVFALPALVFGFASRSRPGSSTMRDTTYGAAGLALGVVNIVMYVSAFASLLTWWPTIERAMRAVATSEAPVRTLVPGPALAPFPRLPHGAPASAPEGGEMTTSDRVTEAIEGDVRIIDLPSTLRPLGEQLREQQRKAKSAGETLLLFVTADGCRPCLSIAAVLHEPKMQAALRRVRLVRVSDDVSQELHELGIPTNQVPAFFLLDQNLHPRDGITGGEWDDDTADNAAPVLGAFVRGVYGRRRQTFTPMPSRPAGAPRTPSVTL